MHSERFNRAPKGPLEVKLDQEYDSNVLGLAEEHIKYLGEQHDIEGLTELKTRKVFDRELENVMDLLSSRPEERRGQVPKIVSLIMIDLDHFKRVNDTYGHGAGDEVLRRVAEVIKGRVRASDTAARYGGEELVVLMPGAPAEKAAEHAEKMREEIKKLTFDHYPDLKVTASFGVAEVTRENADSVELLKHADEALYVAKNSDESKGEPGRNRVVVYGTTPDTE